MKNILWKVIIGLGILSYLLCYCIQSTARLFFVITGSMEPLIPARSIILSKKITADEIKVGKVIIFNDQNNKRVTAHRVMETKEDWYVTKGDANTYQDRYLVNSADVIGAVTTVFPVVDPVAVIVQVMYLALSLVLGILLKRFLLFLKHGNTYPPTTHNAIR